jgi:hypothetical protein
MIPKIVHYVWLGGKPLNPLGLKCLASWKTFLPGWEIRRWNESNSPMDHPYVHAMIKSGRMAFASDLIRLHALLAHGGLYLDTDVELRKSPGELVEGNHMTLGFHSVQNHLRKCALATCWIAAPPDFSLLRKIWGRYEKLGRAVINNTFFTEEILPLFSGQEIPEGGGFEYLETPQVRIYHRDYFGAEPGRKSRVEAVAIHHGTGEWGGQADPLPWWRRFMDFRLDRKILRPMERMMKAVRP